ncbi:hypothetical protein AB0L74_30740 [Streptomyces sp. NPDC052020]|uniref:hypothetical protein n=1 Tax=Streptomyces sp. NPDC052020 TaxID=3155677 RepID=UPI00342D9A6D
MQMPRCTHHSTVLPSDDHLQDHEQHVGDDEQRPRGSPEPAAAANGRLRHGQE